MYQYTFPQGNFILYKHTHVEINILELISRVLKQETKKEIFLRERNQLNKYT